MATITASAAGGKWSETAAWEGGVVPGAGDDVVLAAGSGSITIAAEAKCRSLEASAYAKTLTQEATLKIGAATSNSGLCLRLSAAMKWTRTAGNVEFVSTSGTAEQISLAGKELGGTFVFHGTGGSWQLGEGIKTNVANGLELVEGTLNLNNQPVSVGFVFSKGSATRKLIMGSSLVTLGRASGAAWEATSSLVLEAGTSTIEITNTAATGKGFLGAGLKYNVVTLSGNNIEVTGANTFAQLNMNTARATKTCQGTLTALSNHLVVTEGEANLEARAEVTGTGIPTGTVILKKVEAKVWELSANASETVEVAETVTIIPAGVVFKQGETQTVTESFTTNGKAGELARLASTESGKAATLKIVSGTVSVNYMILKDSHATGGASFYAGANSTNVSGNEGWKFEAPSEAFSGTATIRTAVGVAASGRKTASGSPVLRAGAPTSAAGIKQSTGTSVARAAIRDTGTGAKRASGAAAAGAGIDLGATGRKTVSGAATARVGTSGTAVGVKAGSGSVAQPMGVRQTGLGAKQGTGSSVARAGAASKTLGVKVAGGTGAVRAGTGTIASGVRSSIGLALLRVADNLLTESEGKHSGTATVPAGERLFVSAGKAVQGSAGMRAGVRSVVVGLKSGLGAGVGHVGARLLGSGTAAREGHASIGAGSHSSSLVTKATHGEAEVQVSAATSAIEGKVSLGSALLRFAIRLATFQRPQPTTILVVTRATTSLAVASRSPTTIGVLSRSHTTIEEETF